MLHLRVERPSNRRESVSFGVRANARTPVPHFKVPEEEKSVGVLSVDLSGPHTESTPDKYKYAVVGVFKSEIGKPLDPFVAFTSGKTTADVLAAVKKMVAKIDSIKRSEDCFQSP